MDTRQLYYDNYTHSTTMPSDGSLYLHKLIRRHIPVDKATVVFDIGCGRGELLHMLERAGYQRISGVDTSASQFANRYCDKTIQAEAYSYLQSAHQNSYDVVIAFDVIEHLSRGETFALASEVLRVLRPGGRWILHVPNATGLFGSRARYADITHETAFTYESIRQLGAAVGFATATCYEDQPIVHGLISGARRVAWGLGRLLFTALWAAEVGTTANYIHSQGMLAVLVKR